jgi:hypothetical protein
LILECSQGCYGRTEGNRTDGSITISFCNFVGEGIKSSFNFKMVSDTKYGVWLEDIKRNFNFKMVSDTKCGVWFEDKPVGEIIVADNSIYHQ